MNSHTCFVGADSPTPDPLAQMGSGEVSRKGRLPFDPRTKLFFLIVCNALALGTHNGHLLLPLAVVVCALLVIDVSVVRALQFSATIGFFWVLLQLPSWWASWVSAAGAGFGFYGIRFYLCIIIAYWAGVSTKISHFTQALYALRLPQVLIIPLSVMLRFFPVVVAEFTGVIEAMKLRGFAGKAVWLHPLRTSELIVVPALSAIARIADELAAAALIRGLGSPGRPTRMGGLGFSLADAVLIAIVIVFLILRLSVSFSLGWS